MINGLYSIHVNLLDGRSGRGSGVIVFRDGKLLGGDAYLFYTGTYTVRDNAMRGEVIINQHTPSPDETPLFGGQHIWKANPLIVDKLRQVGALFHSEKFTHSYMHCWRHKTPII